MKAPYSEKYQRFLKGLLDDPVSALDTMVPEGLDDHETRDATKLLKVAKARFMQFLCKDLVYKQFKDSKKAVALGEYDEISFYSKNGIVHAKLSSSSGDQTKELAEGEKPKSVEGASVPNAHKYKIELINGVAGVKVALMYKEGSPDVFITCAGTMDSATARADLEKGGPGSKSYEAAKTQIITRLGEVLASLNLGEGRGPKIHISGHSLGGAHAQRIYKDVLVAYDLNTDDGKEGGGIKGLKELNLYTMNSAGVESSVNEQFGDTLASLNVKREYGKDIASFNATMMMNNYDPIQQGGDTTLFSEDLDAEGVSVCLIKRKRIVDKVVVNGAYLVAALATVTTGIQISGDLAASISLGSLTSTAISDLSVFAGVMVGSFLLAAIVHFSYGALVCHRIKAVGPGYEDQLDLVYLNDTSGDRGAIKSSLTKKAAAYSMISDVLGVELLSEDAKTRKAGVVSVVAH